MNQLTNLVGHSGCKSIRRPIVWTLVFGLLASAGCTSSDGDRIRVAGTVTHAKNPVPKGRIDFVPAPGHETTGPGGYAMIEEGKFDTARKGRGCAPGTYLARITGFADDAPRIDEVSHGTLLFEGFETEIEIQPGQAEIAIEVPEQRKGR